METIEGKCDICEEWKEGFTRECGGILFGHICLECHNKSGNKLKWK